MHTPISKNFPRTSKPRKDNGSMHLNILWSLGIASTNLDILSTTMQIYSCVFEIGNRPIKSISHK